MERTVPVYEICPCHRDILESDGGIFFFQGTTTFCFVLGGANPIFRDSQIIYFGPYNLLPDARADQPDWYRT